MYVSDRDVMSNSKFAGVSELTSFVQASAADVWKVLVLGLEDGLREMPGVTDGGDDEGRDGKVQREEEEGELIHKAAPETCTGKSSICSI